eukprot:TRINITY_DN1779_c0_g1_i1.p1 TRINITY_DN1779_c0_g1~~TRINITY_DN1779_c0_g1_i1.p1  ORF type:complete len:385 (-),score=74.83 TRINITY_DN1779_c0_g1_i1:780-1934(-)
MPFRIWFAMLSTYAMGGVALRNCPRPTPGVASPSVPVVKERIAVTFSSTVQYPVELSWINRAGREAQTEVLMPRSTATRHTFQGHVFRARVHQSMLAGGVMIAEYTIQPHPTNWNIRDCAQANLSAVAVRVGQEQVLPLVHDQAAPCLGPSAEWSCIRHVSPQEYFNRDSQAYGFQDRDDLAVSSDCKFRKEGDDTDRHYSVLSKRMEAPRVTDGPGFLKVSMPPKLAHALYQWVTKFSHHWTNGSTTGDGVAGYQARRAIPGCYTNAHVSPVSQLNLDAFPEMRRMVVSQLQGVLEWWTNQSLQHAETFGMRIYRRDSMLINHVDRKGTHVASAVLQVFQDCDPDGGWPLEVIGEDGAIQEVYLQPGEMVLYEGEALLGHSHS